METVLAAVVVIFVVVFAALTLSGTFLSNQEMLNVSWQEMQARLETRSQIRLSAVDTRLADGGSTLRLTLRNDGAVRLVNYGRWDAIVQYYDDATTPEQQIAWLPYSEAAPVGTGWTVEGLFLRPEQPLAEVFEPGIFNPGEQMVTRFRLAPPVGHGQTLQTIMTTDDGITVAAQVTRNMPPELVVNSGLLVTLGSTTVLEPAHLEAVDIDNGPDPILYTITRPPAAGVLQPGDQFTQADIDDGAVSYEYTGTEGDSFEFTLSDGEDTTAPYTVTITRVNLPPQLSTNEGLILAGAPSGVIGSAQLAVIDGDHAAASLVYTVTVPPQHGSLTLGGSFTQADIDAGSLAYAHSDSEPDTFIFTVSDGVQAIGPYTFVIAP